MEQKELDERLAKAKEAADAVSNALEADVIFFNGDLIFGHRDISSPSVGSRGFRQLGGRCLISADISSELPRILLARSAVEEGAEAILNLAVADELDGRSGQFYNGLRPSKANPQAYVETARERLRVLSVQLTGLA